MILGSYFQIQQVLKEQLRNNMQVLWEQPFTIQLFEVQLPRKCIYLGGYFSNPRFVKEQLPKKNNIYIYTHMIWELLPDQAICPRSSYIGIHVFGVLLPESSIIWELLQ